jgi:hypothetical protein
MSTIEIMGITRSVKLMVSGYMVLLGFMTARNLEKLSGEQQGKRNGATYGFQSGMKLVVTKRWLSLAISKLSTPLVA